ncbi:MAG: LysR family transcriptional regulator [Pseudomonadota bacterium]
MHAVVLKYFLEVAKSGSIRRAAQGLFVASTAVNRQILHLEEELGVKLFDRLPNGIRLTPAGDRLLRHVKGTLHDYHLMRTELNALKGEPQGNVSVAALDSLLIELLPAAIEDFASEFPAVRYSVLGMISGEVPTRVENGEADIGICYLNKCPAGLEVAYRGSFPNGVIMAPSHPLARKETVTFDDCRAYPFLRLAGPSPLQFMEIASAGSFWSELEPAVLCNSTAMVRRLVCNGIGISIFSKLSIVNELSRQELTWRPMNVKEVNDMEISIVVPARRQLSNIATQFLGRLVRRFEQLEILTRSVG